MKKTRSNRYLNKLYDKRQQERVRPKEPAWDFSGLETVVRAWVVRGRE